MEKINYVLKSYDELSKKELYEIMVLRQQVFIVEQDCPYLDADGRDLDSHHLLGYLDNRLVCYTRLLDKNISYEAYCSIGRVVNASSIRGKGMGKELMQKSIEGCKQLFPGIPIKISAQSYLEGFYKSLGFIPTGDKYLEDDIPHMGMIITY